MCDVDMEYLKNTVLQLFTTGEAEVLLPVFATILSLSPDEIKRCKAGLDAIKHADVPLPGAAAAVDTASSMLTSFSGWATWLGASTDTGTAQQYKKPV